MNFQAPTLLPSSLGVFCVFLDCSNGLANRMTNRRYKYIVFSCHDCTVICDVVLANVPSQAEIEARLGRLKQGELIAKDMSRQLGFCFSFNVFFILV